MTTTPVQDRIVCAVMAGGSGTRFWPLSRKHEPKQLLQFFGDKTLLRVTVDRIAPLCPPERQLCVTAGHLRDAVQTVLPELGPGQILAEPAPRNTAPCMAIAAIVAEQIVENAILVLLPSDHFVADAAAFRAAIVRAAEFADRGHVATRGIQPTTPETGYGYIQLGDGLGDGGYAVERFVEKPSLETAEQYLLGGKHLWNAGVFVLRADKALASLDAHVPEIGRTLAELRDGKHRYDGEAFEALLRVTFPNCPSVSIDYGVAEHEPDIRCVRLDAGWSDVGTWHSVLGLRPDGEHNFIHGPVLAVDSHHSVLISKGPYLAAIGLRDMAVVATDDATLVLPLDRSQDVRLVVAELNKLGRADLL